LVEEVELTQANPSFAYICYKDGRESTVSFADLVPCLRESCPSRESNEATNRSKIVNQEVPDIADESEGDVTTSINANERETLPTELDVVYIMLLLCFL